MLVFCLGTAAELIKCYPVIERAARKGVPWAVLSTGQSPNLLAMQFRDFGLTGQGGYYAALVTDRDLDRPLQALAWFARLLLVTRQSLISTMGVPTACLARDGLWVVHGDTLSTLGGTLLGRRLGMRVAHIEAGMRSGNWRSPFPEEVTRRWVSRLASIHYAPNPVARRALENERVSGTIVETCGNTQLDAVVAIRDRPTNAETADMPSGGPPASGPFAIANLHRFENLNSEKNWRTIVEATVRLARHCPIYFVMHPQTHAKIESTPDVRRRLEKAGVRLLDRLPFVPFLELLKKARFLLTDGGGNQDECRVLGLPCLILRTRTESPSGLVPEGPCLLSELDPNKIAAFDADPEAFRRPPFTPSVSPADQILSSLLAIAGTPPAQVAPSHD